MAYQQFDLSGANGTDQLSPPLTLAAGEIAQARFSSCNADRVWFAVSRNGFASTELITDDAGDLCSVTGPATVQIGMRVGNAAHRVAGILEGV